MRIILLILIKLYWFVIPKTSRRRCLFKKSCSHYVYEITIEKGFLGGLKALRFRYNHCRPGYYILKEERVIISAGGKSFDSQTIKPEIF
ncbi:membrane protein insertion efficiency factor YidD [Leeuwenhoekiella polynyae]|uniref:Membrane protein insertion efficiency factor YidD n=2 Tax=Leeuwenhoekiella polynyae TaxID=1550906 RepID=A0A4Q0P1J7_9FLAO|nr:hypothetical protein DSM02_2525 [Leeuwenhoekiella polynyae]